MKQGVLGIFDYEVRYANNLMAYLSQKRNYNFELILFTGMERLNAWMQENPLHILLICEDALLEIKEPDKISHIFLLSAENESGEKSPYPQLYKFQSAERIFSTLTAYLEKSIQKSKQKEGEESLVKLFGVISPNGGSGKTTFALAFAQLQAKAEPTLYLSFEELGSIIVGTASVGGMSDVIYYLKQRQKGILAKIQAAAVTIGGADCIFAVTHYSDLRAIEKGDIDFLIGELEKTGVYQNIIFDFGSLDETIFYTLGFCKKIYITHLQENLGINKEAAFEKLIRLEEKDELRDRMEQLALPWDTRIANGGVQAEELLEGELGTFIDELRRRANKSQIGTETNSYAATDISW